MVDHISSVRYVVAASACCHLANRFGDETLERRSLQLRLQATKQLRERLASVEQKEDLGSLATMLLLAQIDVCPDCPPPFYTTGWFLTVRMEICSGDCTEFEMHLKGAMSLVKLHGSDGTDRCFFEQRLVW